jgi:hypothetical protein
MSLRNHFHGRRARRQYRLFVLFLLAASVALVRVDTGTLSAATDLTFAAVGDARVSQASPTTNYGSTNRLDVDSPNDQSHIRFTVTGVTDVVLSAKLRLFVRNGSSNGPAIYRTASSWTETAITWNNRPAATTAAIADVSTVTVNTWVEYNLTGQVTANGTYDFVLLPDSTDGAGFDSREGSSPPQLVLAVTGGSANLAPVAVDDNATTTENTAVVIDVATNDTDPDGLIDRASATTGCATCTTPVNGTLINNSNGLFGYTPTTGFTGTDTFTYQICDTLAACDTATVNITVYPLGGGSAVFVGAGDIADCGRTSDEATAQLLDGIPGTVFTVGDNAYPNATTANFSSCYEPTWGRHKARTNPSIGDNEYNTSGALPYFNYFGASAGDPSKGYYSYDVGTWHVVSLNSNCSKVGGCGPTSAQSLWLQADLAAHPRACILALHHEPLFSSKGGTSSVRDFWTLLYGAGADVVLSGHRHNYERFAQQTPAGLADPGRGMRQFVVGTGGAGLSSFSSTTAANSEVRNGSTYGVLKLTLHPTSYNWEFVPVAGQTFTDSGSTSCVAP